MYRRLIILSVIIVSALCGLSVLGYHAVGKWAEGLEGARLGDFADRGSRLLERAQVATDRLGLVDTHPTRRAVVQAAVGRVLRGLRRGHDAFVAVGGEEPSCE